MDIFSFINSRDIQNHLKKIDYQFSALECAWLIKQSKNKTIEEKHFAWKELIETMPDCRIEFKDPDTPTQESLHIFLKRYMEIENTILEQFYRNETNTVYAYQKCCDWSEGDTCWNRAIFPTYQACKDNYQKDEDTVFVQFEKKYIDGKDVGSTLITTPNLIPVSITPGKNAKLNDDDYEILYHDFWTLNLDFPTPFSEGDILAYAQGKYEAKSNQDIMFVMTEKTVRDANLFNRGPSVFKIPPKKLQFRYHGYTVNKKLDISHIRYYWYMDLEIVNDYMEGGPEEDLLCAISSYLKGNLDLPDLIDARVYANT